MWEFSASNLQSTFQVDMARHAESFGVGAIDTVAAESSFVAPSNCSVYGFKSLAGQGVPAWSWTMPNCVSSLLYDDDRYVDLSDDGSTVAFAGFVSSAGAKQSAQLWVWDAQTGALRFNKNLGTGQGLGGPVQVSAGGAWVAWTSGDSVLVLDGKTGALRATVNMGWNSQAQVSDSGDFLVFGGDDSASVLKWDATNMEYAPAFTPTFSGTWYCVSSALSSDGSGGADGELVSFAWIGPDALQARVTMFSMVTGALVTDWVSPLNAQLQTSPTVRMDGNYAGVALWGDNDDVPTAVVLNAANKTIFTYTTPGSMFGVDIVRDGDASTPSSDTLYFSVAGKATPANIMGNGGDAYSWRIVTPK